MNSKLLFIVWSKHSRRATTLAAELGGQVSFQYESGLAGRWLTPFRYLVQGWKTWYLLERVRPDAVIVQVPPIFALLIVTAWCELQGKMRSAQRRVSYAIDCHTGTFYDLRWRWSLPLLRWLSRRAAVTLVASDGALGILKRWKVRSLLLIDGLPTLSLPTGTAGSEGKARVAVISGFGLDEPVAEVFAVAQLLPQVTFYISGDAKRIDTRFLARKPDNIILTGFLSDSDYTGLLKNVHGLVNLTKAPHLLTCASYEALAMGKPAVVSDWPQMKRYFSRGFIYVNNTPEAIAKGIAKMLDEQTILSDEVVAMRSELMARRQPTFKEFATLLQS
jgi:glycosyltransferase involved in cell wall biosynthesis